MPDVAGEYEQILGFTKALVRRQLEQLFAFDGNVHGRMLDRASDDAFGRCMTCFDAISNKYFRGEDGRTRFDPFHSGQYSIFLYYLANTISKGDAEHGAVADRVYYLNKALNGLDVHHEVELPDVFFTGHTVGSVLGRARYSNFFFFGGSCTVGNNRGRYPLFGENVHMLSGSKVLGDSTIGSHVVFSANSYVIDTDIPPCSIVFGSSPDLVVRQKPVEYFLEIGQSCFSLPEDLGKGF